MSSRHNLDVYPIPKERQPMYINEPWLADTSLFVWEGRVKEPDKEEDNVRVFVPIDLNTDAILRRLRHTISVYGEATEKNETNYGIAINMLISQVEIYDQIWFVRDLRSFDKGRLQHSERAVELVRQFIEELNAIPVADAECFPYEIIEELKNDYLV